MKKVLFVAAIILLSIIRTASAQIPTAPAIVPVATNPSGNACTAPVPVLYYSGTYYGCDGTGHYAALAAGGSGTVSAGTTGQIAVYPSNGTAVQGTSALPNVIATPLTNISLSYPASSVNLIIDENFGNDWDSAAGFAELNTFLENGEANVLAVVNDNGTTNAAQAHEAVLTYFGRPNIPTGNCFGTCIATTDNWGTYVATNWPNIFTASSTTPQPSTPLLRSILAAQPDGSVTYIAEGLMRDLYDLYNSSPDSISPLTGAQLLAAKVGRYVMCCGDYPTGSEFNLTTDPTAAQVINNLESANITWVGYTLGTSIVETVTSAAGTPSNSPVLAAFVHNGATSRYAWSSLVALYAVRGLSHGAETYFTETAAGYNTVDGSGNNTFVTNAAYHQYYLAAGESASSLEASINALVNRTPFSQSINSWTNTNYGFPTGAWVTSSPSALCNSGTGTVTATLRTNLVGKTAFVNLVITVVSNTSCANSLQVAMPFNAAAATQILCRDNTVGISATGAMPAAQNYIYVAKYDGTYIGATGDVIGCSGIIETQ